MIHDEWTKKNENHQRHAGKLRPKIYCGKALRGREDTAETPFMENDVFMCCEVTLNNYGSFAIGRWVSELWASSTGCCGSSR